LPVAESFSERTVSLPLHMHMTVEDAKYVAEKVKEIITKES
jgi:dTDP-4-amino-4,6-dideoxygalactose transaminase